MTVERTLWTRVEALVTSALERPAEERPAFVEEVTSSEDPGLGAEVVSLVAHATRDPGFLDRVARRLVAPTLAEALDEVGPPAARELPPGQMLANRYRIEGHLGGGGMGQVYRATDTRLDRPVALKLLPARIGADPEARRRFVQEARAASALDHANIATLYDIFELPGGRQCIAMAHYEGRTLAEMLDDGPLDPADLCDLGLQVARGLEAAHGRGIVHCDVKPENVLVTAAGLAKIVDFGLARFVAPGRPGKAPPRGTLPYMAPEQLRAERVVPATDVWALGVTLFEAATGRRAFEAHDGATVARAILEGDPPQPSEVAAGLPPWLDDLVGRALRKDPAERPADAGMVRRALEEVRTAGTEGHGAGHGAVTRGSSRTLLAAAALGLAAVAVIAASALDGGEEPIRFTRPRKLSAVQGVEDFAVWSPGADAVLYQGAPGGEVFGGSPDVLLRQLDAEVARSLTADHDGFDGRPSWSPDGTRMAFYSARDGGGYFVMDVGGGPPRKVWSGRPLGGAHNAAVWSPDGTEVAVTVDGNADGSRLEIVSAVDGAPLRTVPLPGRPGNLLFGAAWSPDGRFVAVADAMNLTPDEARLWVLRLDDGVAVPVTGGRDLAWSPSWGPEDEGVASVTASGLVRAVGNGSATITATTGGVPGSASITVSQGAASLVLSPSSVVLGGLGTSTTVTASVADAGGSPVADVTLTWRSEDESVAIASDAGLVTAVGAGTTTIEVEAVSGGRSASAQLPVTVHPTLGISTTSLPDGIQDVPYAHTLTATGGDGDHVWSVSDGSLPTGLSLSADAGEIVGTPTEVESRSFTIQVESGDGQTARRALSITIVPGGPPAVFSEDFEDGWGSWSADNGIWEVGLPTSGPNGCHSGMHCAGTVLDGDYPFNGSSLVSPTITLPEIGTTEEIHLRFWHWFSLGGPTGGNPDAGVVQIQERISAGVWSESTALARYTHGSGGVWTLPLVDLSAFGGRTVRILFDLQGNHAFSTGAGWYVDDVSVVVVPSGGTLPWSESFENGIGTWWASNGSWEVGLPTSGPDGCHSGVQCAGTVLGGSYPFNGSSLVSPTITLPGIGPAEEIHLRFWHWFSLGGPTGGNPDAGVVYVQERVASHEWGQATELARYTRNSGGVWTFPLIDLSAYGGGTVRILFDLQGRHAFSTGAGWYVDDVSVAVVGGPASPLKPAAPPAPPPPSPR